VRISVWRQTQIEKLIAQYGAYCHYCPTPVRLRPGAMNPYKDDATIDHKVPKSKNGSNAFENLLLACRRCNEAKGDQSYEEFIADPRPAHVKVKEAQRRQTKDRKHNLSWHLPRAKVRLGSGTMAAAIENGSMTENGEWRKPQPIPTWMDWPWLCELYAPLIRDVGSLGPWGNARKVSVR
jgi:HNH endonuclease